MWMADLKHGEHVGGLPAYAPAFKEVYRFILEALGGDDVAAMRLFGKYLAGEMPEELLGIARSRERGDYPIGPDQSQKKDHRHDYVSHVTVL